MDKKCSTAYAGRTVFNQLCVDKSCQRKGNIAALTQSDKHRKTKDKKICAFGDFCKSGIYTSYALVNVLTKTY